MELPVLVITNGVLLPEGRLKVPVRSKTNLAMLDRFIVNKTGPGKSLIIVAYRIEQEKKIFETGTIALVEQVVCWRYANHVQYTIHLHGISRARIEHFAVPICKVNQLYSIESEISNKDREIILKLAETYATSLELDNVEAAYVLRRLVNNERLDSIADFCVSTMHDLSFTTLLEYLSLLDVTKRVSLAASWLKEQAKLPSKDPSFNKEQFRIDTLMGSGGTRKVNTSPKNPLEELEQRLLNADLPDNIKDRVLTDLERLKGITVQSSEHHVLTGYLDVVASLPWNKQTTDTIDMRKARELLNESHDGMTKVKQRVMEYLAVRKINNGAAGPILCFAGPPGIGKTSIAKAIADSLGRKFERISLGGIRDESDIRGHRRTYVAAMPGRIIQALKHANTKNPVILLDEVDKLYAGLHGSPSAALLEVLDPEQNASFTDHYLNLPFDLSNVMFIATANDLSKIEGPLADRLEIIEMSGYSSNEKIGIGERHIIPRQTLQHGICPDHLNITQDALVKIIEAYTKETGVRQLERCIAALCRHAALLLAEALNADMDSDCMVDLYLPITIDAEKCKEILGKEKFMKNDVVQRMGDKFGLGTCFGMAWTPYGGEVLLIEANKYSGKGDIIMTGKLGDVLKESVSVAKSWIRGHAKRYNISTLHEDDVHIHLPAGAVEKDGPSAGCAIVAALFSLASQRNVRSDTTITGEISLSGQILPVGGIKEKILGAHRARIRRVILPIGNYNDVEDLDSTIKDDMEIHFVSTIPEVIEKIMERKQIVQSFSKL